MRTSTSTGGGRCSSLPSAAACLTTGTGKRYDPETETLIPTIGGGFDVAHSLRGEGFDASEDGTGRGTPLVPVAFDTTQITSAANYSNPKPGDPCHPLAAGMHPPAIAFMCKDYGADAGELAPTLRAMGHGASHANAGGQVAVAFMADDYKDGTFEECDTARPLTTSADRSRAAPLAMQAMAVRRLMPVECERLQGFPDGYTEVATTMVTHRRSCPDSGTKEVVPHGTDRLPCGCKARHKPADACPDGPRYKALGNSWAVPCARWIGARIARALA